MGPLKNTKIPLMNETPTCSKCLSTFAFKMALLYISLEIPKSTPIFIVYLSIHIIELVQLIV